VNNFFHYSTDANQGQKILAVEKLGNFFNLRHVGCLCCF